MINDFQCLLCKKGFIMEDGHPIYSGKRDQQYCSKCLSLYQNQDGTMPMSIKKSEDKND